ncbi:hypothetical protein PORY_000162 [Pneumocystis oryctolagi]|uniref:Uncharacterized protein n=1 Tax=Pneumocystis oryctolagi TaxID=42067 RepID=A0ACB7CEI6_9ASCO|nr:hypothetical protein PORY_000162 [Pneumocystis oryctolagi]
MTFICNSCLPVNLNSVSLPHNPITVYCPNKVPIVYILTWLIPFHEYNSFCLIIFFYELLQEESSTSLQSDKAISFVLFVSIYMSFPDKY